MSAIDMNTRNEWISGNHIVSKSYYDYESMPAYPTLTVTEHSKSESDSQNEWVSIRDKKHKSIVQVHFVKSYCL